MHEFSEYLVAVLDHWFFWFGGIVLVIFELIKKIPSWKNAERWLPVWSFWSVAALCVFIATFQAWHDEHAKSLAETTYMEIGPNVPTPYTKLPVFEEGRLSEILLGRGNTGAFIAEGVSSDGLLEIHDANNPKTKYETETNNDIENEIWNQFERDRLRQTTKVTVLPGRMGGTIALRSTHKLSKEEVEELKAGKKLMYEVAFVTWKDGAGIHENRYCSYVQPSADKGVMHLTCLTHNDFLAKAED